MICKSCGAQLEDNAKFCANCGAPVEPEKKVEHVQAEQVNTNAGEYRQPVTNQTVNNNAAAGAQYSMISQIIMIVASVLCTGCCGGIPSLVLAIISLVKVNNAKKLAAAGKKVEADAEYDVAKKLNMWGWIVFAIMFVICLVIGFINAGAMSDVFEEYLEELR